jgi:hypothetical protein
MLKRAGFPDPIAQKPIDLGKPLGTTTPDFFYADPNDLFDGICIYLDGMSKHLHGNPETQQRDRQIRETLNNRDYKVIEIPVGNLDDRQAMAQHFHSLGRILLGKERAKSIRDNPEWFDTVNSPSLGDLDDLLSLFDAEWHPLVQSLIAIEGISLEPGGDVPNQDAVVGTYLFEISNGNQTICVLDAHATNGAIVQQALLIQGKISLLVDPNGEAAIAQILQALEEAAR